MILIVDDDKELCNLLSDYLEAENYNCSSVHDGQSALDAVEAKTYDLVILDVMLPNKNGFDVLSELRTSHPDLPVIMLTAKGDSIDMIVGLEMGADDYLSKPFNPRELLARIRTVLRRLSAPLPGDQAKITVDGFELSEKSYCAFYKGNQLNLTPLEFRIFCLLLNKPGEVISRDILFKKALGRHGHVFDRSLDMHISRLRKKIETLSGPSECVKSIRNEGYIYVSMANPR